MQTSKIDISFKNIKSLQLDINTIYSLETHEVVIYTINLLSFAHLKDDLFKFLNSAEIDRANRFHKEIDRHRFIIYRAILKLVLAAYTSLDVKNISFNYHLNKKPYLASHPFLHFNISHSEDFAVIAVSSKKIGIDIEYLADDFKVDEVLLDIFNESEIAIIQNSIHKKHAFYTLWTRKEALVKAVGKGIDDDFKYIPCLDGEHTVTSNLLENTKNWQLFSFDLETNYVATVAFESASAIHTNVKVYTLPNSMRTLLEMCKIVND